MLETLQHAGIIEREVILPLEAKPIGIDPGGPGECGGVGYGRIAQAGDPRAREPMVLRLRDGNARRRVQSPDEILPMPFALHSDDESGDNQARSEGEREPGAPLGPGGFPWLKLRSQTGLHFGPKRFKAGGVAVKLRQVRAAQDMNAVDRVLEASSQFARRIAADHSREIGVASRRNPDLQIADAKFVQPFVVPGLE